jgi:RNA polymerase sigma factor (sigma-70 family)
MDEKDARRDETNREFERLYRRHRGDVYRAAMRRTHDHFEAEDVTQSAFLDAYRAVLRGTEPELPRAWLLAIAENVRRRRFAASLRRPRPVAVDENLTAAPAPQRFETEEIVSALESLPPNQCAAFVLREVGGLSYPEIASRLEVTVPSVQMLLFRARQGIRAHLAPPDRLFSGFAVPAWLTGLVHRFEAVTVGARAAGAVGATVVVAAGVNGALAEPRPRLPPPARPSVEAPSLESAPAATPAARPGVTAAPARGTAQPIARRTTPATPPARAPRSASTLAPVSAQPPPPDVVTAAPAAPSTEGSTVSGNGEPAAAALVPAPPAPDPIALPVPEAQPLPVPVVELPSAEGPDVPALDPPVVPEVPVDVGGTPPLPPLPPLPPQLPPLPGS